MKQRARKRVEFTISTCLVKIQQHQQQIKMIWLSCLRSVLNFMWMCRFFLFHFHFILHSMSVGESKYDSFQKLCTFHSQSDDTWYTIHILLYICTVLISHFTTCSQSDFSQHSLLLRACSSVYLVVLGCCCCFLYLFSLALLTFLTFGRCWSMTTCIACVAMCMRITMHRTT